MLAIALGEPEMFVLDAIIVHKQLNIFTLVKFNNSSKFVTGLLSLAGATWGWHKETKPAGI